MEYTKVTCKIDPNTEANREILIAELGYIGYESFSESDELVEAYIKTDDFSEQAVQEIGSTYDHLFSTSYSYENIADQNWNEVWEKNYFQPLLIAGQCLIRAPYHTVYPSARYEVIIEPGMAFGTGNHETTALMVTEILNQNLIGKAVLDMGCGTGILSILASKRGADKITGIDIDQWAIGSTIRNATTNKVANLEIIQGGAEAIPDRKFDFIYANIHRNVLLNDIPQYFSALNKDGELIMSGFYLDDLECIKSRASEFGLQFTRFSEKETWVSAVFTWK